ncbi:UNVERIFIED_ORG: hypothetical protein JN05_04353 [Zoogloea ramigera]|uniref:Uncharacterized protein n=1 Tax=Duganella zoogloeoides TaxID=75659 RepID=A0ABZ0XZJ3_9BURK|nr:hypothetical protein [Duganella zoogloeoides]WQH05049.1 hypothetical protein SR858_01510 [Duganella zoogloeoides]
MGRLCPGLQALKLACASRRAKARFSCFRTHEGPQQFKLGDTVSFTDKHLRERVGTIVRMNTRTYSLLCEDEQWRMPPALVRKIIDL